MTDCLPISNFVRGNMPSVAPDKVKASRSARPITSANDADQIAEQFRFALPLMAVVAGTREEEAAFVIHT